MNNGQLEIRMAGHRGAQQAAKSLTESYCHSNSDMRKRKHTLDYLEEAGYSKFLLMINDDGPEPLSHGTSGDRESFTHWAIYDLAEVKAYALARGEDLDNEVIIPHGGRCPDPECKRVVTFSRKYDTCVCEGCGEHYAHRENDVLLSICEEIYGGDSYGGPGRTYVERAHARVTARGTRVIVKQSGGLDI